jgi:hypothetical protein
MYMRSAHFFQIGQKVKRVNRGGIISPNGTEYGVVYQWNGQGGIESRFKVVSAEATQQFEWLPGSELESAEADPEFPNTSTSRVVLQRAHTQNAVGGRRKHRRTKRARRNRRRSTRRS